MPRPGYGDVDRSVEVSVVQSVAVGNGRIPKSSWSSAIRTFEGLPASAGSLIGVALKVSMP